MSENNPSALKTMMAAAVSQDGKPAPSIRKKLSFVLPAELCLESITQDIEITIGSLTSGHEVEAARMSKGDANLMGLNMAKLSLMDVNGTPISRANGELDWLWENIGTTGRQAVMGQLIQLQTPSEESLKKVQETTKVH